MVYFLDGSCVRIRFGVQNVRPKFLKHHKCVIIHESHQGKLFDIFLCEIAHSVFVDPLFLADLFDFFRDWNLRLVTLNAFGEGIPLPHGGFALVSREVHVSGLVILGELAVAIKAVDLPDGEVGFIFE